RGGLDPTQTAAYNQLGQQVRGDLARGTQLTPEFSRQLQQSVRAGQSARGNVLGNDAVSAEALYQGQRAQQLYQQRVGNVQNFTALPSPGTTAYQAGAQLYGMQSPQSQALAQAGSFLSSPTPEQQLLAVQGVSPDRSSAYVNPK